VVPQRMRIKATAGNVKLDFTEAVVAHRTLHIELELRLGADLLLVTKPGIVVETDDLTVRMGDIKIRHVADQLTSARAGQDRRKSPASLSRASAMARSLG
jgi:hypothetical protein